MRGRRREAEAKEEDAAWTRGTREVNADVGFLPPRFGFGLPLIERRRRGQPVLRVSI
jgi:hypothetical protein